MSEQKMREALVAAYMAGNQHGHNSTVEGYWSEAEDVANEYADEALAQPPAAVPDSMARPCDCDRCDCGNGDDKASVAYADGWNAYRAALLAASQPEVRS